MPLLRYVAAVLLLITFPVTQSRAWWFSAKKESANANVGEHGDRQTVRKQILTSLKSLGKKSGQKSGQKSEKKLSDKELTIKGEDANVEAELRATQRKLIVLRSRMPLRKNGAIKGNATNRQEPTVAEHEALAYLETHPSATQVDHHRTASERLIDAVVNFASSPKKFTGWILGITALWTGGNAAFAHPIDPWPFPGLTLILSLAALIPVSFLLYKQKQDGDRESARAQQDYETDLRTEAMVQEMREKIDSQSVQITDLTKVVEQALKYLPPPSGAEQPAK